MKTGVVKFFKTDKGFGFISSDDQEEIFFHFSGASEPVTKGDRVSFEVKQGQKGLNAINIKKI
jgi:CspA family cold shock protein